MPRERKTPVLYSCEVTVEIINSKAARIYTPVWISVKRKGEQEVFTKKKINLQTESTTLEQNNKQM